MKNNKRIEAVLGDDSILTLMNKSSYTNDDISQILEEYYANEDEYIKQCELLEGGIKKFRGVHLIRSRVKSDLSICRKVLAYEETEGSPRITKDNFSEVLTDIVGVRAIYLYISDYYQIYEQIRDSYSAFYSEKPRINFRDNEELFAYNKILPLCEQKQWKYRSIHYTLRIPMNNGKTVKAEIQTRTVFEEGWSEVNQRAYKNGIADTDPIGIISGVINRLVGTSNELAELMRRLEEHPQRVISKDEEAILFEHEAPELYDILKRFWAKPEL